MALGPEACVRARLLSPPHGVMVAWLWSVEQGSASIGGQDEAFEEGEEMKQQLKGGVSVALCTRLFCSRMPCSNALAAD